MSKNRLINTSFWKDNYVADLDPTEKLLFNYLFTNPRTNIAGVYEINVREMSFDTGIDKNMVEKIIERFAMDGKIKYESGWIIMANAVRHQTLNPSIVKGIHRAFDELPEWLKPVVSEVWTDKNLDRLLGAWIQPVPKDPTASVQEGPPNLIKSNIIKTKSNRNVKHDKAPAEKQPTVKTKDIDDLFLLWEQEVGYKVTARTKMNREYASKIIKEYPAEDILPMLKVVGMSQDDQYAPRVSDFIQLYRKWDDLKAWVRRKRAENPRKTPPVKFRSAT